MKPLSPNLRAVALLAGSSVLIAGYSVLLDPLLDRWERERAELARHTQTIARLQAALQPDRFDRRTGGRLELPADELTQRIRFKRRMEEQFQKAGVALSGDPQYEGRLTPLAGSPYKLARLSLTGNGKHASILKLAETLYDNPYLGGLEEFNYQLQGRDRSVEKAKFTVKVTVTTLIQS